MVAPPRYRIETWSRPQLEDNFHNVVSELQNAQKKNKEQEKQIAAFNSRFRRNLLERKHRDDEMIDKEKYEDVVKEKEILDMKLKAAKHQLLLYTAPSARAATASAMTGRSTFRQPPSTWRQRQPVSGVSIDRTTPVPIIKKKIENDRLQLGSQEKVTIIKLNRTLKLKEDEISELKYTIAKLKEQLSFVREGKSPPSRESSKSSSRNNENSSQEDDEELSEMSDFSSKSATPIPDSVRKETSKLPKTEDYNKKKSIDSSEKILRDRLRVAENDLQIAREECNVLKITNEQLVQQSFSKSTEYGTRENIEDKKKIVELEEQLKETERRIKESEYRRKEDQKKYEEMRLHYKKKLESIPKKTGDQEKSEGTERASPPPIVYEAIRKRPSQSDIQRMRKADDDLLDKLYKEVADILVSHDVKVDDIASGNLGKWQKLYAEVYEELEKVRNMLVVQYDINQKQQSEIQLLSDELVRLKTINTEKVNAAKNILEQKQKKIFMLEEQIKTIAYSDQKSIKLTSDGLKIPTDSKTTDLSIKLLSVKPSASLTSKFFFSLEFFDFQLTTTPIMEPRQQSMDFTTIYDVVVSNLLLHYLQTSGIVIEMYKPATDKYKQIGVAVISLIPLLSDNVIQRFCSETEFKSIETGEVVCSVQYEIEISQPFIDSYKLSRKSEIAKTMIPLNIEESNEEEQFEPLTIMINRVIGLENVNRDPSVEFCVIYELLSFSPYFTDFSTNPEIRSKRDCLIPKSNSARNLFSTTNISFYIVEQIPKEDGLLSLLNLPLLPLCKPGGSIKGIFEMMDIKSENKTGIFLDISIMWKHQIPAFFAKPIPSDTPPIISPLRSDPVQEVQKNETPILATTEKRPSKQFEVSPVKEEDLRSENTSYFRTSSVQMINTPTPSPPSSSSSSSNDVFSPVSKTDQFAFDIPETNTNEGHEEEIESVSALSQNHEDHEASEMDEMDKSQSTIESIIEIKKAKVEDIEEEYDIATPSTQRSLQESTIEEEDIEEVSGRKTEKDEIRSLLGVLPPIAKPREKSLPDNKKGVIFKDPLHNSIPPSDSSSTSSPRRSEKLPVSLPEYEGHGVIKVAKPPSPKDGNELEPDLSVTIRLEKFEVVQFSRLLMKFFDDAKVIIDCGFLDFSIDELRSEVFDLPRNPNEPVDLNFTKDLKLTKRQFALLDQWIELSNRVDFTLISVSPGEEEELAVAQLTLFRNNSQNELVAIDFIDINGEHLAELQLSVQYSSALLQRLK